MWALLLTPKTHEVAEHGETRSASRPACNNAERALN